MTRNDRSMTSMVSQALTEWVAVAEIPSRAVSAAHELSTTSRIFSAEWVAEPAASRTFSTTFLAAAALHAEETRMLHSKDRASAMTSTFHSRTQFTVQKPKSLSSTTRLVQSATEQAVRKAQKERHVRLVAEAVRSDDRQDSLRFSRHVLLVAAKVPGLTNRVQNAVEAVTRLSQRKCRLRFQPALMTEKESQFPAWAM